MAYIMTGNELTDARRPALRPSVRFTEGGVVKRTEQTTTGIEQICLYLNVYRVSEGYKAYRSVVSFSKSNRKKEAYVR